MGGFTPHSGDGDGSWFERLRRGIRLPSVAADPRMAVMQSRHEDAARRRADRRPRLVMRESQAFTRHAIKVLRLDHLLTVAAQVDISQIIRDDEADVGPIVLVRMAIRAKHREADDRDDGSQD